MDNDLEALGTNAHELPMVLAALAPQRGGAQGRRPTRCCRSGRPTTAATSRSSCPMPSAPTRSSAMRPTGWPDWTGFRPDSAPAIEGGEKIISLVEGTRPRPAREAADLLGWARRRHDRGGLPPLLGPRCAWRSAGGPTSPMILPAVSPFPNPQLDPISLVCKVSEADGRPAVKLSGQSGESHRRPRRNPALYPHLRRQGTRGAQGDRLALPARRKFALSD